MTLWLYKYSYWLKKDQLSATVVKRKQILFLIISFCWNVTFIIKTRSQSNLYDNIVLACTANSGELAAKMLTE